MKPGGSVVESGKSRRAQPRGPARVVPGAAWVVAVGCPAARAVKVRVAQQAERRAFNARRSPDRTRPFPLTAAREQRTPRPQVRGAPGGMSMVRVEDTVDIPGCRVADEFTIEGRRYLTLRTAPNDLGYSTTITIAAEYVRPSREVPGESGAAPPAAGAWLKGLDAVPNKGEPHT